jgi:hypothetical protein
MFGLGMIPQSGASFAYHAHVQQSGMFSREHAKITKIARARDRQPVELKGLSGIWAKEREIRFSQGEHRFVRPRASSIVE